MPRPRNFAGFCNHKFWYRRVRKIFRGCPGELGHGLSANGYFNVIMELSSVTALAFFRAALKIGVAGKIINPYVYVNLTVSRCHQLLILQNIALMEGTVRRPSDKGQLARFLLLGFGSSSITAVVHDVGGTNCTMGNGLFYKTGVNPPPQAQEINAGFGLFPIFSPR